MMSVRGCYKIFSGSHETYFGFIIEDGEALNVRVSSDIDGGSIPTTPDTTLFMPVLIAQRVFYSSCKTTKGS